MEEYVGSLWHRFITRAAETEFPEAAVNLPEVSGRIGIFFRARGGDTGLAVRGAGETAHGARRSLLQRFAGSNRRIAHAWSDGEALHLPPKLAAFPDRTLNRDLYYWLAALAAHSQEAQGEWIVRSQKATRAALDSHPGLAPRYSRLLDATLALRPAPASLPADEAAQERAIRQALKNPGSVATLPPARRAPQPVPLWLHPEPPTHAGAHAPGEAAPNAGGTAGNRADDKRRRGEYVDMPDGRNGIVFFFRAESILSWAEFIRVNRPVDDSDDPDAARDAADDLDILSIARDARSGASRVRFDLDLPPASDDDIPLGDGILLPEWDYRSQRLQPRHCKVQPMAALDAAPWTPPQQLAAVARRLRRQFQVLAPARTWVRGLDDGCELDLDAYVRYAADRAIGLPAEARGLYRDVRNGERSLACLLLADLSQSTDAWVGNRGRVIEVIRDSLYLFSESLSQTGDRFAVFGFSSLRRNNVRFHIIKGFADRYDAAARARIAAIKPGFYTRMGAAIRHAAALLSGQQAERRLLLLLTDGKPNDLDLYEGRYGIEDTRMAVQEARALGLEPFCVTIDDNAGTYLPHLFGSDGFIVIRDPAQLPQRLPQLYARLTRR